RFRPEYAASHALTTCARERPHHVRGADGDIASHAAGAAVAGRAVHARDEIRLHAFPHERVLASPRPHHENLHRLCSQNARLTPAVRNPRGSTARLASHVPNFATTPDADLMS